VRAAAVPIGLAIVPALAAPAAALLAGLPVFPHRLPAETLPLLAQSLLLASLFLAPLASGSDRPRGPAGLVADALVVGALAAGPLAAAALFSGSGAPAFEAGVDAIAAASAFFLSRLAAERGARAVARHLAIVFAAVVAAPFLADLLADLCAPGREGKVGALRALSPLRALAPFGDGEPRLLALALPAALLLSALPRRPAPRRAALLVLAAAPALAGAAGVETLLSTPARPGEWVAVRAAGGPPDATLTVSIGGGTSVELRSGGPPALVPVGPFGAASAVIVGDGSGPRSPVTVLGPGAASPGEVRVGFVGVGPLPSGRGEEGVRVTRLDPRMLALLGAEAVNGLDAIVVEPSAPRLLDSEEAALLSFARRGAALLVPRGHALESADPGLGSVTAFDPGAPLPNLAARAARDARPDLSPGAIEEPLALLLPAWRGAAETSVRRGAATLLWGAALAVLLVLAFARRATAVPLLLASAALSGLVAAAALVLRGESPALAAAARVVVARASGGPGRVESWLALFTLARDGEWIDLAPAGASPTPRREVLPVAASLADLEATAEGGLRVFVSPLAARAFVSEEDGDVPGSVEVGPGETTIRNATPTALFDVVLARGGSVVAAAPSVLPSASANLVPPGAAERPPGIGASAARFLLDRTGRAAPEETFVIARRDAGGPERERPRGLGSLSLVSNAEEWLVLRVDRR